MSEKSKRMAALNDALRHDPGTGEHGRIMMTRGVSELGIAFTMQALAQLEVFADFTRDNDPWSEHDFGAFEVDGHKLFWKVDYFEKGTGYMAGAETPENPMTTDRVLTIMLAEEY